MRDNHGRIFTATGGVYVHLYRQRTDVPPHNKTARLIIEDMRGLSIGVVLDREGLASLVECAAKAKRDIDVVEIHEAQAKARAEQDNK